MDNYKNFINKKIDLIKIDTEGHELNLLKGTEKIDYKNMIKKDYTFIVALNQKLENHIK